MINPPGAFAMSSGQQVYRYYLSGQEKSQLTDCLLFYVNGLTSSCAFYQYCSMSLSFRFLLNKLSCNPGKVSGIVS